MYGQLTRRVWRGMGCCLTGANNGARAGLAAIKWIAGTGIKYLNTGG
eukprot:COSAG06_NODE_41775_length_387_cov_59.277778_1_plen_46_part_10